MGTIHTHDSQAEDTNLSSVLVDLVQQPTDNSPMYTKDKQTCQLKFKGPYNVMKDINNIVLQPLSAAI